ncbi:hypothetical protein [uncultured Sphingosinicella sp.]|uniref:5'-methylthioadenosine/S-adenosylhomocysteine nucleosidase family protein n=1 Tax=uncultured Sphingosinicella sp. TaxID=478748 RepID=UPI0030D91A0B
MRRNIFLHFLNRDTREVFDLYRALTPEKHAALMRRALNAAAIICEDRCVAPPGFIVEDEIAFGLAENQRAYLSESLIQLPMREDNLAEFAEKKRIGYEPMRDRYSGLYNDTRIGFLGDTARGIIQRKTHITAGILKDWTSGPEAGRSFWKPAKTILTPPQVDLVAKIPLMLDERGVALTWSAIAPELPDEVKVAFGVLRGTLQHVYFRQYCQEFNLCALSGIPHVIHDFRVPVEESAHNFKRLGLFLDLFELRELLFEAPADLIVSLKKQPGFIAFCDAYAMLAQRMPGDTNMVFYAGRIRNTLNYSWASLQERRFSFYEVSPVEVSELASVLDEFASRLTTEHGLATRSTPENKNQNQKKETRSIMVKEPELVLFVALEEELEALAKSLNLTKTNTTPEAHGTIDGVQVAVICPRTMGRVAAAVAMTSYLTKRNRPPKLILIVGLAGGFAENRTEPGHIIVVTKVVDLALRKVVDDADGATPNFRSEDYAMDDRVLRQIHSDAFDKKGWTFEACDLDWPEGRRPSLHYGPLASADEVVASDDWRKKILQGKGGNPKLLGVEMEAGGVCAAAARQRNIPVSMLRVVSDQADPSKADDNWRKVGMKTLSSLLAAISLGEVLKNFD